MSRSRTIWNAAFGSIIAAVLLGWATLAALGEDAHPPETHPPVASERQCAEHGNILLALAWPGTVLMSLTGLWVAVSYSPPIRQMIGMSASLVRKIKFSGVELELSPDSIAKTKEALRDSIDDLVNRAKVSYESYVSAFELDKRLSQIVCDVLPCVLAEHGLPHQIRGVRGTVHVPCILFSGYLYQLTPYAPSSKFSGAGRRFSMRYGLMGRAWRSGLSIGRGQVVGGDDAEGELIREWGMTKEEARMNSTMHPADLCVILRPMERVKLPSGDDKTMAGPPCGMLWIDAAAEDAFGANDADRIAAATAVAEALERHPITLQLAEALYAAMTALRMAGPGISLTHDLK